MNQDFSLPAYIRGDRDPSAENGLGRIVIESESFVLFGVPRNDAAIEAADRLSRRVMAWNIEWQGSEELDMSDFVNDDGEFDEDDWIAYDSEDHTIKDGMAYYIRVTSDTGTAYEGWWGDADSTLEMAIEEALRGSCLTTREQASFPELWKGEAA